MVIDVIVNVMKQSRTCTVRRAGTSEAMIQTMMKSHTHRRHPTLAAVEGPFFYTHTR